MADINQLELAILNLAINARDAMPDGGEVKITTAPSPNNAHSVTIAVSDTGSGMPPEVAARAFDPFFTTKPAGKGTGLGLSQVYGLAQQIGGDVTIKTALGEGTTMTIHLPRADDAAVGRQAKELTIERSRNGERLLLVDDDADVREIVTGFLSDLGYHVEQAEHGEAALNILGHFNPDLLIVDFSMPGMNGAEVARTARERNARLPFLFL